MPASSHSAFYALISFMNTFHEFNALLGLGQEAKDLTFVNIALRGLVVFMVSLLMIRLADKRFLAKMSAFDALLGFILASMLARAINGSSSFFPTLGGGFVIVGIHRLCALLAYHWDFFGTLVKGEASILVRDGQPDHSRMRKNHISEKDLMEEARINGQVTRINSINLATMERNGQVSIIPKK
jgi:uncharacterized membrane protein YcaP (DUF421 family)